MAVVFAYPEGKRKALTMSYDDGVVQDRRLVALFNQFGIKGTFHLNSALLDHAPRHIAAAEVPTLYAGHEVSCHTATHPFLERLDAGQVMREIWNDRLRLEELAGCPVIGMSYPFGTYNEQVIAIARAAGIVYSRSVKTTGSFSLPEEFMAWDGSCHHRDMLKLAPNFLKSHHQMPLFYVWGHAYEFDDNHNWEEIEEFCRMVSGQSDVWYATNLEVYRYIQAVRSVVSSADGTLFFNPSAQPVWLKDGEVFVKLSPGETRRIAG